MALIEGTLLNDRALQQALRDLPQKLQNKAVRQALRDEAKPIAAESQGLARTISQRLARSIKVRTYKTRRRGVIGIAIVTGTRDELGIPATDRYFWPAAFEFGTKERISRGRNVGRIAPVAYLRRPLFRRRATMLNSLATRIRQRVNTVIASEIARSLKRL